MAHWQCKGLDLLRYSLVQGIRDRDNVSLGLDRDRGPW